MKSRLEGQQEATEVDPWRAKSLTLDNPNPWLVQLKRPAGGRIEGGPRVGCEPAHHRVAFVSKSKYQSGGV